MNTKRIIIVVIVLIIIAGAIILTKRNENSSDTISPASSETSSEETSNSSNEGSGTIANLFSKTGNFQCTVSSPDPSAVSNGTFYISNGKVRGDFASTIPDFGSVESHMIRDTEYVYVWTSSAPQGMKIKMDAYSSGSMPGGDGLRPTSKIDYDCKPWTLELSKFTPPSGITFMTPPVQ